MALFIRDDSSTGVFILAMVILFLVMVPVLSTQRIEIAPRVSTDESFFTRDFFLARRHAPTPRNTVNTTGNSSES